MNCERPTPASVTSRSRATPPRSTVVTAIALTATLINRRANRSALSSGITGTTWCRPTSVAEREQAVRYGAVPERRTDRLESHAATPSMPSPNHASGHSTTLAARQSLDLAAQARALVSHSAPERPLRRHPVLLSTHHPIGLETTRERPAIANGSLD